MSTGPEFELPDGTYTTSGYLSTTKESRFYVGRLPADADITSVQVSVRGGPYSSDPDWIFYTDDSFVIPNPEVYPDGLPLITGANIVKVKATSFTGPDAEAQFTVSLVSEAQLETVSLPPTNIRCESYPTSVKITVDGLSDTRVVGYNFYASTSPGGGTGYTLVNTNPVNIPEVQRQETLFGSMDADIAKVVDAEGQSVSSPQLMELILRQRNLEGAVISTDVNEVTEIPSQVGQIRAQLSLYTYSEQETYSLEHDRSAPTGKNLNYISEWAGISSDTPLYYVVTALYYDAETSTEVESPYSPEIATHPTSVTANLTLLPPVTRETLTQSLVRSIHTTNPEVAVQPGSVIRDLFVDPFITEQLRLRTIIDFLHKASSFPTLLAIDDPLGLGQSVDPRESTYKKTLAAALHLSQASRVQPYIDACFDKLAANLATKRSPGSFARGEVTFFTAQAPTSSLNIPLGTRVNGGGASFRTTENAFIDVSNLASYYNPTTKEWSVTVGIRASDAGTSGNVSAGQINSTNAPLSVRNAAPTFGGSDRESNMNLASRAHKRVASVDTGTEQGYLYAAASLPGVEQVRVVGAGDPLMLRDYDKDYDKHVGGKVDIWMRGSQITKMSETFSFQFEYARDIQFELISDLSEGLEFRALDKNLTQTSPMLAMLDYQSPRLGLLNASTGEYFDLDGVELTSHNTIKLNTDIDQPSVDFGDVVLGDYRYRTGSDFVLPDQPVVEVTGLTGSASGSISKEVFTLVRPNPPLTVGRSSLAAAYLHVEVPVDAAERNLRVPTGDLIEVTNEEHVITGDYIEYFGQLGVLPLTVKVTSKDGLTEYRGPYHPSGVFDYTILEGDQTTPSSIQRVAGSSIGDGETVLFSYKHDENFTVDYTSNLMVKTAQEDIDNLKHLTADVLVKETTVVYVDIAATLITQQGANVSSVDKAARVGLGVLFNGLALGDPVRQSDVIEVLDSTTGVSHVLMPLVKMCLQDGSQIIRELVDVGIYGDFSRVHGWSTPQNNVYLLSNKLAHSTSDGGGAEFGHYVGVFKDTTEMSLITDLPNLMGRTSNQAFVIGGAGMVVPGISDDETIRAQGYVTEEEITLRRQELTQNRVLLSLPIGETPEESEWSVTYTTVSDSGVSDLEIGPSSYFRLGNVEFTLDEDRASSRFRNSRVLGSRRGY